MKELTADITLKINKGLSTREGYLSNYKKDSIIEIEDYLKLIVTDIDNESISLNINEGNDRFSLANNKIIINEEIKINDNSNNPISVVIRLDRITEVQGE